MQYQQQAKQEHQFIQIGGDVNVAYGATYYDKVTKYVYHYVPAPDQNDVHEDDVIVTAYIFAIDNLITNDGTWELWLRVHKVCEYAGMPKPESSKPTLQEMIDLVPSLLRYHDLSNFDFYPNEDTVKQAREFIEKYMEKPEEEEEEEEEVHANTPSDQESQVGKQLAMIKRLEDILRSLEPEDPFVKTPVTSHDQYVCVDVIEESSFREC